MPGVVDKIQLEDLDSDQRQLAEIVGMQSYRRLIETFGGVSLYIPKPDSFEVMARNEQLRREFDGYNFRELARKYNLSEVWVRSLVSDRTKDIRGRPIDGQVSLFNMPQH